MTLRDIIPENKIFYDSSEEVEMGSRLLDSFYIPVLSQSIKYRRLTGYFSSRCFTIAARGIETFINNGGKMEMITGHVMTAEDINAINEGEIQKIEKGLIDIIESIPEGIERDHVKLLGWLVAKGLLDIKIAIVNDSGNPIFHKKIAYFEDIDGNKMITQGSINESKMAYTDNDESFSVYRGWIAGQREYFEAYTQRLNKYFTEKRVGKTHIISIPDAVKDKLIEISPNNEGELDSLYRRIRTFINSGNNSSSLEIEDLIKVIPLTEEWRHQVEASNKFIKKQNGVLEMATGTGKTMTAYRIINSLVREDKINSIIIATFGNDLLDQWYEGINNGLQKEAIIYRYYGGHNELTQFELCSKFKILILNWDNLVKLTKSKLEHTKSLIIIDEIHGFGALKLRDRLSGKISLFSYRLGLSATPERNYDEDGNQFITNEIGEVIYRFTLKDAIERGILCEFDYYPVSYNQTNEDRERIRRAYATYNAKVKNREDGVLAKNTLYMDLADVRKLSKGKLPVFTEFLSKDKRILNNSIIFVKEKVYGKLVQDISIHYNPEYHTYYSGEDKINLIKFKEGNLSYLITCKKLSQGIDIKSIKNIILFAADRGKLQTIQRIGRCLRIDDDNVDKRASVVDFIMNKPNTNTELEGDSDLERMEWLEELSKIQKLRVDNG